MKYIHPLLFLCLIGCIPQADEQPQSFSIRLKPAPVAIVQNSKVEESLPDHVKVPSSTAGVEGGEIDTSSPTRTSSPSPRFDGLLCGLDQHNNLMRFWPKGPELERIKNNGLILYDDVSMPKMYQVADEGAPKVLRTNEGQTTANNEFPWALPAGVASNTVKTFRFIQVTPENPILWYRGQKQNGAFDGFKWYFQPGTRFGEVLLVTDSRGFDHTVEVRTRVKRTDGNWSVQVYRPLPTEEDFRDALLDLGYTYGPSPHMLTSVDTRRQSEGGHVRNFFISQGINSPLPTSTEYIVLRLLDRPFEPVKGKDWSPGSAAPTSQQSFNVVPRDFFAGIISVDNQSCLRCHNDAGNVVNLSGDRRWRIRGSDRIISFHIFDPADPSRLNPRLVAAGLLVKAGNLP